MIILHDKLRVLSDLLCERTGKRSSKSLGRKLFQDKFKSSKKCDLSRNSAMLDMEILLSCIWTRVSERN